MIPKDVSRMTDVELTNQTMEELDREEEDKAPDGIGAASFVNPGNGPFAGPKADPGTQCGLDVFFPRSWVAVLMLIICFGTALVLLTVPLGLAYNRFDVRALACYEDHYYKKPEDIVSKDEWCEIFSYPYRLTSPDLLSRALPSLLYFGHQFGQWYIIWQAQQARARKEVGWDMANYSPNIYARRMFALNLGMVIFKFVQSHFTYDGLANDVPEVTALYSVAMWLFFSMAIQMRSRGLFFGYWRSFGKFECVPDMIDFVRVNHGYAISFGTTYNFWYHPLEGSPGFVLGYLYQFCMILQSGFLFHPFHRNKFWTLLLEMGVVPHALFISLFIANGSQSALFMFVFGFAFLFISTYMHGFDLTLGQKAGFGVAFCVIIVLSYLVAGRELSNFHEIFRIGSSFLFVPVGQIVWWIGCIVLLPFKSMKEKNPWLTGLLWFLIWAVQVGAFYYMGPMGGRGDGGQPRP